MKKQLFTFFGVAILAFNVNSQNNQQPKIMPCGTFDAMEEGFKKNPELKKQFDASQAMFEKEYQLALNEQSQSLNKVAATVYTVPVVFHIMGSQNISDQTFINFMAGINRDYARLGGDTGSISSLYKNLYVDAEIRFAIAKKDPNGNCTNGIIHHDLESKYWDQNNPNYKFSGTGTNRWPPSKYLNIYIVNCIASSQYTCPVTSGTYLGGYTYLPGSTFYTANGNMGDAIVYLTSLLGQANPNDSRTLSHEIGHWLNLYHTFGQTNNPGSLACGDLALNDFVGDTPETQGHFSSCPSSTGGNTCDASSNSNVENIMDYSSCTKMFTQGQITRMRTAITNSTGGRNNLWTTANYIATGLTGSYTCTPVADFKSNKTKLCSGQTLTYTDMSQGGTSGSVSWTFEGGTPASSTATLVVVTYPTAGTYSVSLTATNSTGTNTKNQTSYVTVTEGAGGIIAPYAQNFEGAGVPSDISVINGNAGSIAWEQNTATGGNTTAKSIYLNNASTSTGGNLDIFETSIFDFHNTTNVSLSYWYAYAKKTATQVDTFKVQYSLDCGGSWTNVIGIPSITTMATNTGGTTSTAFVPISTQWKQANVSSALLATLSNKPSVKFRFYFRSDATVGSSNNIYIDEINLTGTVGLNELENMIGLTIYPNPTNASAVVNFIIPGNETSKISVLDIVGRVVEESTTPAISGKNVSYTVNKNGALAKGIYIVNIDVNNQRISRKLIIE